MQLTLFQCAVSMCCFNVLFQCAVSMCCFNVLFQCAVSMCCFKLRMPFLIPADPASCLLIKCDCNIKIIFNGVS